LLLITVNSTLAIESIQPGATLTLNRCLELALQQHPSIRGASGAVEVNRSRVEQAKAPYYPQIDAAASYDRLTSAVPNSPAGTSDDPRDQYGAGVTVKQLLYDFGKTPAQVGVQSANLTAAQADYQNVSDQVIFNTKQAYYGILKAARTREVAAETVRQFQLHLDQAKSFFEVGTRPRFDVTKAEVDLSNAQLNLIKAENGLRIARVLLNNAMGLPNAPEYSLEDNLAFAPFGLQFDAALRMAYDNRPDLKSVLAKKLAAERSMQVAKKGYYPTLAGNASYTEAGESLPLEDGWSVGVTATFPIFSGFLTKNQVEEAGAALHIQAAGEEALRQSIYLEVQQAYLNLREAGERIDTAALTVKQAEENYEIANGRYRAGVGNPIEVTDAEIILINAKTTHIEALYDYRIAQSTIEKAMGEKGGAQR
jgi:outer membrane protein TolC